MINAVIQSGTTEDKSAFVIRKDNEGVFLLYGNIYARSIIISEMRLVFLRLIYNQNIKKEGLL